MSGTGRRALYIIYIKKKIILVYYILQPLTSIFPVLHQYLRVFVTTWF